jgi:hypothetical protein
MRTLLYTVCLALVALSGGCRMAGPGDPDDARVGTPREQVVGGREITGTVRFMDLEGGFYGIITDDGARLDPMDLPAQFRQDGLRVRARVEPVPDAVTFRMWGTVVRVLSIERL